MKSIIIRIILILLAIPIIFFGVCYYYSVTGLDELTGEVYDGFEIDRLKASDALWLTKWKGSGKGVLIEGEDNIQRIIDSISFAYSGPGACGFQWNVHFMKNGHLLEKTCLVKHCHKNFRTDFGCFAYNIKFRSAMKPYTKSLEGTEGVKLVYDFFFPVSVPIEGAFDEINGIGFCPFVFENEPARYPNVTVEYTATNNSVENNSQEIEKLTESQAIGRLERLITDFSDMEGYRSNSDISSPGGSYGGGSVSVTKRVTVFFEPETAESIIRGLLPKDIEIRELKNPEKYSVQILFDKAMSVEERERIINDSKLICDIKER